MKLLLATALSVVLAISGAAYAQTQPDAGGTDNQAGGGAEDEEHRDVPHHSPGPVATMRPEAEIRTTYEALAESDRTSLKAACETNTDVKFTDLCRAVNAM